MLHVFDYGKIVWCYDDIVVPNIQSLYMSIYGRQVHCILELDTVLSIYTMSCTLGYSANGDVNNYICLELCPNAMNTLYFHILLLILSACTRVAVVVLCVCLCLLPS